MKLRLIILLLSFSMVAHAQSSAIEFENAKQLFREKNFRLALYKINNLLAKDSGNVEYFMYKSDVQKQLEMYQDALYTISVGVEKFPLSYEAITYRGNLLLAFNEPDEAIKDFNTSLRIATVDSLKVGSYINLDAAKIWKRDFSGAYTDLHKALLINPLSLGVLSNLAAVCDNVGKGSETLKHLFKSISIDSNYVAGYAGIGFKYQELGRHKEAIEYYNKVLELEPNQALGYSNRSFSRLKLEDVNGALEDINKSIAIYPENAYAYKVKALVLIEMGEMNLACDNMEMAISRKYEQNYGGDVAALKEKYCR